MKKFLKTVTAGALAATFAVSLTACGKKDEDENVLNVMLGTSVKSLDAQVATDGESFEVIAGFTDGLMQMDANGRHGERAGGKLYGERRLKDVYL